MYLFIFSLLSYQNNIDSAFKILYKLDCNSCLCMETFNNSKNEVILVYLEAILDGEGSRGRGPRLGLIVTSFEWFLRWDGGFGGFTTPLFLILQIRKFWKVVLGI